MEAEWEFAARGGNKSKRGTNIAEALGMMRIPVERKPKSIYYQQSEYILVMRILVVRKPILVVQN